MIKTMIEKFLMDAPETGPSNQSIIDNTEEHEDDVEDDEDMIRLVEVNLMVNLEWSSNLNFCLLAF
jgi:hypothetical protein